MADPSKMTRTATFTVGKLLCKDIRRNLDKAKFMGYNLEYFEDKGGFWLWDSYATFTVRGDDVAMSALQDYLRRAQEVAG